MIILGVLLPTILVMMSCPHPVLVKVLPAGVISPEMVRIAPASMLIVVSLIRTILELIR